MRIDHTPQLEVIFSDDPIMFQESFNSFFANKTPRKVGGELNENNNVYLYYMGLC